MKVKYFRETDTALFEFLDAAPASTREINEDVYVDLDLHGNWVSMTIEHARRNCRMPDLSVEQFNKPGADVESHR